MVAFDAASRSGEAELMDDASVDYETFRGCLADLSLVNRLSLGYRPTIAFLEGLRTAGRLPEGRPLAIVDVGSGYGDTLREIAKWAARRGVAVRLTGVDLNKWSAKAAAEATPASLPIAWKSQDVFTLDEETDVVISALFTHHLDDGQLARFLAWSEKAAGLGWFVNDLHRHRISFVGFRLLSRLLRMHRFVQHDGPVSIARSFVAADWRRALAAAGAPAGSADIGWWFPFRLCVARVKPA